MFTYIVRRIVAGFMVVLGATFIAYLLVAHAGDPLAAARGENDVTLRAQKMKFITENLNLDVNPVLRYFIWLKGVAGCFKGSCDFGNNVIGQQVSKDLGGYALTSLKLITAATFLAILIGVTIGVVTALRQYSGFDYAITLMTFLFFALPVFWVGILLKELVAIRFNDFLQAGATFSIVWIVILALFFGLTAFSIASGKLLRRLMVGGITAVVVGGLACYVSATSWLLDPQLGPITVAVIAILIALGMAQLNAGLANRKVLYTALTTAVIGIASYYPFLMYVRSGMNFGKLMIMLAIAIAIGIVVGIAYGGDDRKLSARTGALTALCISVIIFIDRLMRAWRSYSANPEISGRPLATVGAATPNLEGDFWIHSLDAATHLLLPTITVMLISLAGHSRYARASMLEVLNQDYIRTARSKGLTERTVIMRHALRNALIPLTTIIAFDIAGLLGGAALTEQVYGWKAMGQLFVEGLRNTDPNPVMAFFLVNALLAVLMNIIADISYAALDPRIRVGSK